MPDDTTRAGSPSWAMHVKDDAHSPFKHDSLRHAAYSAIVTLTLGVLGSTVLPVPFAFSKLGVLPGCVIMAVVAFANDRTCCMLVRASAVTHRTTYEALAHWAGGTRARVVTQWSLILLLYGTLCGGLAFLSDVAHMMVLKGIPGPASSGPLSPTPASPESVASLLMMQHTGPGLAPGHWANISSSCSGSGLVFTGTQVTVRPCAMAAATHTSWGTEQQGQQQAGIWSGAELGTVPGAGWWAALAAWLQQHVLPVLQADGRPLMLLVVATILYPLCLQPHIRQFEKAATVGVVVVVALMAIIVWKAVATGFPAVASGQLPVWGFRTGGQAALPEAFAVLGFAFYMQPMLMPLVAEMPAGEAGRKVSEWAVHVVLYGVACSAYGVVGVFGAATYGDDTQSNIMVNDLLAGQPGATLLMYGALLVYLCCGMVTTHYALRASMEVLLTGTSGQLSTRNRVLLTSGNLLAALAVACSFPTQAERIFAFTGCTAVCLVCYVLPCYIHLKLEHVVAAHGRTAARHLHQERRQDLAAHQQRQQQKHRRAAARSGSGALAVGHPCSACGVPVCTACGGISSPAGPVAADFNAAGAYMSNGLAQDGAESSKQVRLQVAAPCDEPAGDDAGLRQPLLQAAADTATAEGAQQDASGSSKGRGLQCSQCASNGVLGPSLLTSSELASMVDEPCSYPFCVCGRSRPSRSCWQMAQLYALPVLIVMVGVGCSVAGLYVGILDVYHAYHHAGAA